MSRAAEVAAAPAAPSQQAAHVKEAGLEARQRKKLRTRGGR